MKSKFDKFYTNSEVVDKCLKLLDLGKYDCIIEPSAGNGSFSSKIPHCFAYDIKPEASNIIEADWFEVDKKQFKKFKNILVVGNPPFGFKSNLAVLFFNEAAKFCNTIAFVLPLTFKKASITNRLDLNFHLKKEIILDKNSFLLNGEKYDVPSVFQIWEKSSLPREKIKERITSSLFSYCDRKDADIKIARVGRKAGTASLDLDKGCETNYYFIKNNSGLTNERFVDIINSIKFEDANFSVGQKSLTKVELVKELELKCATV